MNEHEVEQTGRRFHYHIDPFRIRHGIDLEHWSVANPDEALRIHGEPRHGPSLQRIETQTERQVSLVLLANVGFFIAAAIAAAWSLLDTGTWFLGHLIGVGITGQVCTMFCLAWLLTQNRAVADALEGADDQQEDSGVPGPCAPR